MKVNISGLKISLFVASFVFLLGNISLYSASIKAVESGRHRIVLSVMPKITDMQDIVIDGISYKKPNFQDAQNIVTPNNQGAPANLTLSENLIVPSPDGFTLTSFKITKTKKISGILYPNPEISTQEIIYHPDITKYTNYTNLPPIQVKYKGIAGDRYIADISINPIIYNHATQEIEIIEEATAEIAFNEKNAKYTNKKFDDFLIKVINAKTAPNWYAPDDNRATDKNSKYSDLQSGSNLSWAKIKIDREGIYYLNIDDLNKSGFDINSSNANTIRIYGFGGEEINDSISAANFNSLPEQEFYIDKDASGKPNKIIFYAAGPKGIKTQGSSNGYNFVRYINTYSTSNYYLISVGGAENNRINPTVPDIQESADMKNLQFYRHYLYDEEDLVNANGNTGRSWYGKSFFPMTISNKFYNLDRNGKINYFVKVGHTLATKNVYGIFTFTENGKEISNLRLPTTDNSIFGSETNTYIPAADIASDDRSILKIDYNLPNSGAQGQAYIDYYIISYPRSFSAVDNELNATVIAEDKGINSITAVNFSSDKIYGWDISKLISPKIIKNYSNTPSIFIIKTITNDTSGNHFYLSSAPIKANIEKINLANIRDEIDEVDMLLIAHPDLQKSAEEYAKYRTSRGIKTKVYLTSDIYNEFGAGIPGPYTIKNFIAYKYNNSQYKPKYVYLWGGTHYDYRNIVVKSTNFIPIFEGSDSDGLGTGGATDELYSNVKGDDKIVDVALGRATIENNEEGGIILSKIKHYENSSSTDEWRRVISLVADDSFGDNGEVESSGHHTPQCEILAGLKELDDLDINKIYSAQFPMDANVAKKSKSKVTDELLNSCNNTGNVIVTYLGHGNPRVWAHEGILEKETTIPRFQNLDKMFFCFTGTCDFGRIDIDGVTTAAEDMFKHKQGAAIALYTTLRGVGIYDNGYLAESFHRNLLNKDVNNNIRPIGSIVAITRNSRGIRGNDMLYLLLGDPSLKLLLPEMTAQIDTINGIKIEPSMQNIVLKGLDKVTVIGKILNPNGEQNTEFNGTALINLYDPAENITFTEPFGNTYTINKSGNALGRNATEVKNGRFELQFIIPKDISFAEGNAKLNVYAISSDSLNSAIGITDKITINAINESAVTENNGPVIDLFLDRRNFKPGDLVSATPMLIVDLSDESGINTAGAGIGHKIEAWIDDSPESIDLTNLYKSSLTIMNSGTIEKKLNTLKPGVHSIRVRAWDVYNNYTVNYTDFKVGDNGSSMVLNTFMYPNPLTESGNISITHSINSAYDIVIKISDCTGKIIKVINKPGSSLNTVITEWDGKDEQGIALNPGSYFYTIELQTKKETAYGYGKFIVIR